MAPAPAYDVPSRVAALEGQVISLRATLWSVIRTAQALERRMNGQPAKPEWDESL